MDDNCYLTFSKGFPLEAAIKIFVKKHGEKPAKWFIEKNFLKLGPEPRTNTLVLANIKAKGAA